MKTAAILLKAGLTFDHAGEGEGYGGGRGGGGGGGGDDSVLQSLH